MNQLISLYIYIHTVNSAVLFILCDYRAHFLPIQVSVQLHLYHYILKMCEWQLSTVLSYDICVCICFFSYIVFFLWSLVFPLVSKELPRCGISEVWSYLTSTSKQFKGHKTWLNPIFNGGSYFFLTVSKLWLQLLSHSEGMWPGEQQQQQQPAAPRLQLPRMKRRSELEGRSSSSPLLLLLPPLLLRLSWDACRKFASVFFFWISIYCLVLQPRKLYSILIYVSNTQIHQV